MKKWKAIPVVVAILFCMMAAVHLPGVVAADLQDGTYIVEYEMLQAENDSVSIANDYFEKPATLTVDKDGKYLRFTVNQAKWIQFIKSMSAESFTDVSVVSEDLENDKRVVAFKVDEDISAPLSMQMHVVIDEMEPAYDHKYSVRLALDLETLQVTDAPAVVITASDSQSIANESTSNKALNYVLLAVILIAAIILIRKVRSSKQTKK